MAAMQKPNDRGETEHIVNEDQLAVEEEKEEKETEQQKQTFVKPTKKATYKTSKKQTSTRGRGRGRGATNSLHSVPTTTPSNDKSYE